MQRNHYFLNCQKTRAKSLVLSVIIKIMRFLNTFSLVSLLQTKLTSFKIDIRRYLSFKILSDYIFFVQKKKTSRFFDKNVRYVWKMSVDMSLFSWNAKKNLS